MSKESQSLNILQLTLSFENGGRKEAIKNLAIGLKSQGHKVFLGCVTHRGTDEELPYFEDVAVFEKQKLIDFSKAKNLYEYCQKHSIDLIHAHDAGSLFFASHNKWLGKKSPRQIMTFHRSLNFETATIANKLRNVCALMVSEGVITVSNARGRDFIESNYISPKKLQLINLSADVNRFQYSLEARNRIRNQFDIKPTDIVCGAMGHFGLEKGIDVVIRSFGLMQKELQEKADNVHLLILGKGTEEHRARLNELVTNETNGNVHFAGFHPDPESYFSAFDIFVHTPREENGATVLFEAMATGLPIVATQVGGVPEAVIQDETGLLAPSEAASELAQCTLKLIDDNDTRQKMGLMGLKRCHSNFTREHYVTKHVDFYREVLG